MSTMYERIDALCKKRETNVTAMCRELEISRSSLSELSSGRSKTLSAEKTAKIATYFGVSVDYLLGKDEPPHTPVSEIGEEVGEVVVFPVLVSVRAGFGSAAVETYGDDMEAIPKSMMVGYSREECRVLRVKGDSMYPRICDGDKVLIHLQDSVDSGSVAVVIYNGEEATIKKVRYEPGENWVELIPANPEFMTRRIEGKELEQCRVIGKVIRLIRDF